MEEIKQKILEEKKKHLQKTYPFWLHEPNPKQLIFYQLLFNPPKAEVVLSIGSNQGGKTTANIVALIIFSCNILPLSLRDKIQLPNLPPGSMGRIIATDFKKGLGKVYHPKLFDMLPKDTLLKPPKRNPQGIIDEIVTKRGITVDFLTYEQPTQVFEGWTGDFAGFDELPPRDKYIATKRGMMARQGVIYMTFTPPASLSDESMKEAEWIYDELYLRSKVEPEKIKCVEFDIYDNIKNLNESAVEAFEKSLNPDEKIARFYGKFIFNIGLIYSEFDRTKHVIEPFEIPSHWPVFIGIDPHSTAPTATVFAAVDRENVVYVFDELYTERLTLPDYVREIRKILQGKNYKRGYIDPSANEKNPLTHSSYVEEYRKCGLYLIPARKDRLDVSFEKVRDYIKNDKLKIFSSCNELIKQITKLTPSNKDKMHLCDSLRYMLSGNISYMDITEESMKRYRPQNPLYASTGY